MRQRKGEASRIACEVAASKENCRASMRELCPCCGMCMLQRSVPLQQRGGAWGEQECTKSHNLQRLLPHSKKLREGVKHRGELVALPRAPTSTNGRRQRDLPA